MVTPVYDRGVSAGLKCAGNGSSGSEAQNKKAPSGDEALCVSTGAGEAIRTPDPHLGKVMLYP